MYNPATGDGNDPSDNDEADDNNDRVESNDRVANEHAVLTATESLVNQTGRRTEPHAPGTVPTEATPREPSTCRGAVSPSARFRSVVCARSVLYRAFPKLRQSAQIRFGVLAEQAVGV